MFVDDDETLPPGLGAKPSRVDITFWLRTWGTVEGVGFGEIICRVGTGGCTGPMSLEPLGWCGVADANMESKSARLRLVVSGFDTG